MDQLQLMRMINRTHREWIGYMKQLALEAGIPDSYRMAISYVSRHPGASQKDLALFYQLSYAAISQTISDMQRAGYLTKSASESDQRYAVLNLTEKGQQKAEELHRLIQAADDAIAQAITTEKATEMVSLLQQICDVIQEKMQ